MQLNLRLDPKNLFLWTFILCLTFSTVNTKIAGSAWGILVLAGLVAILWKKFAPSSQAFASPDVSKTTVIWLFATLAYCMVIWAMTWYWQDSYSTSLAHTWRLLAAAAAAYALTVCGVMPSMAGLKKIYAALIVACIFAAILSFVMGRSTPSNPIPWAAGVGMIVCLLLPCCLQKEFGLVLRMASFLGAMAGVLGILFSLSRGAFVIIPLALVFIVSVLFIQIRHGVWGRRAVLWGVRTRVSVLLLVGLSLFFSLSKETLTEGGLLELPLQRVQQVHSEFEQAVQNFDSVASFQTSTGIRLHLWHLGWTAFLDSPWLGHGVQGRLHLIHNYQDSFFAKHAKASISEYFGHVHNQFLNHLVDYGLLGMLAVLGLFLALLGIAWTERSQRVVFWQASGLAVFTFSTLLTNANLAHNYFSTMWSLAIFVLCSHSVCFSKPKA